MSVCVGVCVCVGGVLLTEYNQMKSCCGAQMGWGRRGIKVEADEI